MSLIRPVVAEARRTFPVKEYGYGARFRAPGTKIRLSESNGDPCLVLNTPGGRQVENGRYSHGWDCFEASYFIKTRLHEKGLYSRIVELGTPLFSRDYAVCLSGDHFLSITPGVNTGQLVSAPGKKHLADDHADSVWKDNRTADLCLTNGVKVFGLQQRFGIDIMNCFLLKIRSDGMLGIQISSGSIRNGEFGNVADLVFSVDPGHIERCRTAFQRDGNKKGFAFMTMGGEVSSMDAMERSGDFFAVLGTAHAIARKVVPMVMRMLDSKAVGFLSSN